MTISIGNDHAGTDYKFGIIAFLEQGDYNIMDFGTDQVASVDYPDFVHPVSKAVSDKRSDIGVVLCGSGNGAAMTANKYRHIRAAICWTQELSYLARQHNDANVLVLPARFISLPQALDIVKAFINTPFEGGRHSHRIEKITPL